MRGDLAERTAAWLATGQAQPKAEWPRAPRPGPSLPPALLEHVEAWVPEAAPQEPIEPVVYLCPGPCRNCAQPVAFRSRGGRRVSTVDVLADGTYSDGHKCVGVPKEVYFKRPPPRKREPREWETETPYDGAPAPLPPIGVRDVRGVIPL